MKPPAPSTNAVFCFDLNQPLNSFKKYFITDMKKNDLVIKSQLTGKAIINNH